MFTAIILIIIPFLALLALKDSKVKSLIAILLISIMVAGSGFFTPKETITIEATNEKNEEAGSADIELDSIIVDGKRLTFTEIFGGDVWRRTADGGYAWREFEDSPQVITGSIEAGNRYIIRFVKHEWRGIVKVTIGDKTQTVDCYNTEYVYEDMVIEPGNALQGTSSLYHRAFVFGITFVALCLLNLALILITRCIKMNTNKSKNKSSESLLFIITMFLLVLLDLAGENTSGWYGNNMLNLDFGQIIIAAICSPAIMLLLLHIGAKADEKIRGRFIGAGLLLIVAYLIINITMHLSLLINQENNKESLMENILNPPNNVSVHGIVWIAAALIIFSLLKRVLAVKSVSGKKMVWLINLGAYITYILVWNMDRHFIEPYFPIFVVIMYLGGLSLGGYYGSTINAKEEKTLWAVGQIIFGVIVTFSTVMLITWWTGPLFWNGFYLNIGILISGRGLFIIYLKNKEKINNWLASQEVRLRKLAAFSGLGYLVYLPLNNCYGFMVGDIFINNNMSGIGALFMGAVIYYVLSVMIAYMILKLPFFYYILKDKQTKNLQ